MKKTLAILLALVLCFSAFALIACNKCDHNFVDGVCTKCGDKDPNYNPGGNDNADVPTVDGKVTFYFTMADDSVAIPAYASVYFAGTQTNWNDDPENPAPAMTKLGNTKIYYVQLAYDATLAKPTEYTLVLGYNEASGLPADQIGLKWVDNYKSDTCKEFAFGSNATFTYTAGANKVNLGTHKFSTEIAEPTKVNTTFAITFLPALPETAEVYIIGSMNEWNTKDLTKSKMTADANRETYTLSVNDVLCTTHYYKVLVFLDGTENVVKPLDKDNKEMDIWNWQRPGTSAPEVAAEGDDEEPTTPAEKKYLAYIEISAGDDNLPVDVAKRNNNSTIDLAGTVRKDQLDKDGVTVLVPRKGLDILTAANLKEVEGKTTITDPETGETTTVPNGIIATKYIVSSTKTLTVNFATALPETAEVYIDGSMLNNWKATPAEMKMTISADRKSATKVMELLPCEIEFRVIVIHKDIEIQDRQTIWDFGTPTADTNGKVNITGFADEPVMLYSAAQTVPDIKEPEKAENVVLKVKFDNALPAGKHVFVAGNFEGWSGTEMTVDPEDPTVYTLTLSSIIVKDYEFKVAISDTAAMNWGTAYGKNGVLGAQVNEPLTITKDSTEVQLYGTVVLAAPKADVSATVTVTFAGSMEGKVIVMKGSMTGWNDVVMTTTDNITYSAEVSAAPGTHGFLIGIGATEAEAKTYAVKVAGTGEYGAAANGSVTIPDEGGTVALFGTTVIPVAPPVAE